MATKKIKRFQEGGMSDKDRGLEASKDDKVGFFERLRMGNIDEEGSEAYNRFGAGRGKAARTPVETMAPSPVRQSVEAAMPERSPDDSGAFNEAGSGVVNDTKPDRPKPGGRPLVNVQATKPSASASGNPRNLEASMGRGTRPQNPRDLEAKNSRGIKGEGPPRTTVGKTGANAIPDAGYPTAPTGNLVEPMSDTERNIKNILAATGVAGGAGALYKGKKILDARKAAQAGAKKRANLKRDVEEGIERNLADEVKSYSQSAAEKAIAAKQRADYRSLTGGAREDAKANQAYDKLKQLSSRGAGKTSSGKTKKFNDEESNVEFKRGGSVSSASKRADGIATKGKTRCKMR